MKVDDPRDSTFALLRYYKPEGSNDGSSTLKYRYAVLITHYIALCLANLVENIGNDYTYWKLIVAPKRTVTPLDIEKIIIHPNYHKNWHTNNIAMIKVSSFIQIANF